MRALPGLIASLCIGLVATAPASAKKPGCAMKGSKTVLRDAGVRVFTAIDRETEEFVLYGCLSANGRKQLLSVYEPGLNYGRFYGVRLRDYTAGSLAVTRHGGSVRLTPGLAGVQQLTVADRDGTRVLDSGNIAPASVRAEISIVSWSRDGIEHFARLR